jgi:hypothetical protein
LSLNCRALYFITQAKVFLSDLATGINDTLRSTVSYLFGYESHQILLLNFPPFFENYAYIDDNLQIKEKRFDAMRQNS